METFFALLAISAGNSPVSGEFPTQRPVSRSFDVFFDPLNKRLSKQWWGWWFETPSRLLWRHCNEVNLVVARHSRESQSPVHPGRLGSSHSGSSAQPLVAGHRQLYTCPPVFQESLKKIIKSHEISKPQDWLTRCYILRFKIWMTTP